VTVPRFDGPAAGGAASGVADRVYGGHPPDTTIAPNATTRATWCEPPAGQRPQLRPYQVDAIEQLKGKVARGLRRLLLIAPTGSGKTVIAATLIAEAVAAGKDVVLVTHRRELTEQTSRKLYDIGVDHGIVQAGFPSRPGEKVQVCSVQTLHARAVRSCQISLPPADLLIIDEAHHVRSPTYMQLIEAYPNAAIVGLTATPCRGDGRGLGNAFQSLVECPGVAELTRLGYLVPVQIFAPVRPDLSGVRIERGDYVESQLAQRMNTAPLVGDIVTHWHRLAERRRSVVFTVNVAHSAHIRDEFRRSGVLAEHIDGSTALDERKAILAGLKAGIVDIVCNCAVLTEGWDRPETSCLILARPTRSLGLFRQMVGRILRPAPGKADAIILDHSGAVFQHGFPDDEIVWTLHEDRRVENKAHAARGTYQAPALTTCPECAAVRFEGRPCPVCGWHPVTKPRRVKVADGELGRVDRQRHVEAAQPRREEKLRFHRQLAYIARERGYRDGWIAHKYKERFGIWPPTPLDVEPLAPSLEIRSWVRSRQIAYAKSMAAAARS
jgi:superfamily II DNA or RNA helicase